MPHGFFRLFPILLYCFASLSTRLPWEMGGAAGRVRGDCPCFIKHQFLQSFYTMMSSKHDGEFSQSEACLALHASGDLVVHKRI